MIEIASQSSGLSDFVSRIAGRTPAPAASPRGPVGERAYVVGDVHGCLDQMTELLARIEADNARRDEAQTHIVFLGDVIDRGPHSRKVVDWLIGYDPDFAQLHFLMGNHEEVFLDALAGNTKLVPMWFDMGGLECARSYGVEELGDVYSAPEAILEQLKDRVPQAHIDFLGRFEDYYVFGDFLCVHAGIKPKVPLSAQSSKDLRWIREPFLQFRRPHEYVVVHGHTVVGEPQIHRNRIAVDRGVYETGHLSCLMIEEDEHVFISVG